MRTFQIDLRDCISGGEDRGELYTERKFLQVKAIVERFSGREGQADFDARWRDKVADVRNWFEFGAKERWRADGAEREFYRDSSGKSGGQKEKLAYTILAAALAYQFGLGDTQARQRHFRFVVIDEAFGRGCSGRHLRAVFPAQTPCTEQMPVPELKLTPARTYVSLPTDTVDLRSNKRLNALHRRVVGG